MSEASLYVNLAVSEVASRIGMQPLEAVAVSSTTSGENKVALPPDFHQTIALTCYVGSNSTDSTSNNTTTFALIQRDSRFLDSQNVNGTGDGVTAGIPEYYQPFATWFELFPSPNSAYSLQLRYFAKPQTLVDSTDTPTLDERWMQGVLFRTVALLEGSRNNMEGEAVAQNRYLSYMQSTPTDRALKHLDRTGMTMAYKRRHD
jgi:hypothetical protein